MIAAALSVTACQKSDGVEENLVDMRENKLTATLESRESRTQLGSAVAGVYKTLWSDNDAISVFIDGSSTANDYLLIDGAGTTEASFAGRGRGYEYVAVYPSSMVKGFDGTEVVLDLPAVQSFSYGSFGDDTFPMIAVSSTSELQFRNLCAVLKLSLTGSGTVQSITFSANNPSVSVSGMATVISHFTRTPELRMMHGEAGEVTLECGSVTLDKRRATDFYIVVPAQTYQGGFTLTIKTPTGYMVKSTDEDIVMERSQLRAVPAFELKLDAGLVPSESLAGNGSESSPFVVATLPDLLLVQSAVNCEEGTIVSSDSGAEILAATAYYRMTADIDMSEYYRYDLNSWIPIGNYSANSMFVFNGHFDGGGHTIRNLLIDSPNSYQGLFGYVGKNGTICNLAVDGEVKGDSYVGMICGFNDNVTADCTAYGRVDGKHGTGGIAGYGNSNSFYRCTNYAQVDGTSTVGGIVGTASLYIAGCRNYGAVSATDSNVGGIVGYQNSGNLYNCFNEGLVLADRNVGGISGYSRQGSQLVNSYNSADVYAYSGYAGGIIGYCDAYTDRGYDTAVLNCISTGEVQVNPLSTMADIIGGICGCSVSTIKNCYWLTTASGPADGIGRDSGVSESVYGLGSEQIRGKTNAGVVLYVEEDGTYYKNVIDALNAWAASHEIRNDCYFGWRAESGQYPTFTYEAAIRPEGGFAPEPETRTLRISHSALVFAVPVIGGSNVEGTVEWGDQSSDKYSPSLVHTYTYSSLFDVTIKTTNSETFELNDIVGVTRIDLSEF